MSFCGKYHDHITGLELAQQGPALAVRTINDLLDRSGALNVASARIVEKHRPNLDATLLRVTFDPWYWTGRSE